MPNEPPDLAAFEPNHVFDGGDMDCGSGLILLIRQNMLEVPAGGVMEMRSREPSVADELPPWCRMVGHEYLGTTEGQGFHRFFIRRGQTAEKEQKQLAADKEKAKQYTWRLRARAKGQQTASIYCRNFSWTIGQPASFEERDKYPSAVEGLLGSLAADLCVGFATQASRQGLEIDDLECSLQARLHNVLAHLGLEEGDPSIAQIDLTCYASSFDDEMAVRQAWETTLRRSPLFRTLEKNIAINTRLAFV